jgi:hypothetical protein
MAGSVHSVLSSPMKGGHRGPARPAGPRADGGQRSPHFGEAATLGGHTGTQRRGRGPAGGRLACLIPGPPPCPAPSLLAPPGHVFLARSGPSSILIAIIPCNGVGWRLLCGGPEQYTPLRGPVWGAWRQGNRIMFVPRFLTDSCDPTLPASVWQRSPPSPRSLAAIDSVPACA